MGALKNAFPYIILLFYYLALYLYMGFPFTSGFFSKEAIFNHLWVSWTSCCFFFVIIIRFWASGCTAALFCTINYFLFFLENLCGRRRAYEFAHESSKFLYDFPLYILTFVFCIYWLFNKSIFLLVLGSSFFDWHNFKLLYRFHQSRISSFFI